MLSRFAVIAAVLAIAVSALDNGMGLLPPLGWSSWCSEGGCETDYCHEAEVRQVATAMLSNGLHSRGYRWIILDDCWAAGNRTADGSITWDETRFPSGIPALVHWLHTKGFMFGIYTSAGNATCSSGGRPYPIPGSEHHYQQDMDTFASWGADYVKVDWCGDVHKMPLDGLLVGAKDYIAVSNAITNTTPKRRMYLEGVAAYIFLLEQVGEYVNAWRAATDHHDNWKNTQGVLDTVELVGKRGKPGAWSFMDVIMTGGEGCSIGSNAHCPGMSDTEYITEFTLWSIYQSPLICATNVRNMTAIMNKILLNDKLLSIHQDTSTEAGKHIGGDATCSLLGEIECQYFLRLLHDGSVLLALFNAGSASLTITFDFSQNAKHLPQGWGASGFQAVADDQWQRGWANTTVTGKYSATVDSHGVNVVRLYPVA
jgi:alpha-galactosidase